MHFSSRTFTERAPIEHRKSIVERKLKKNGHDEEAGKVYQFTEFTYKCQS